MNLLLLFLFIVFLVTCYLLQFVLRLLIERINAVRPEWIASLGEIEQVDGIPIRKGALLFILTLKYRQIDDEKIKTYGNIAFAITAFLLLFMVSTSVFYSTLALRGVVF